MKTNRSLAGALITVAFLHFSQTLSAVPVVGYNRQIWHPGDNLICNSHSNSVNTLSGLIPSTTFGTTVSLWNTSTEAFDLASTFTLGGWTTDLPMPVGSSALLNAPILTTNFWAGTVLTGDGELYISTLIPPSPFIGPAGTYNLGNITPIATTSDDVFLWAVGRAPDVGESVTTLDPITQIYTTTTFIGPGFWSSGTPELAISESALFTIIPEPASLSLVCLFIGGLWFKRRFFPST